MNRSPNTGVDQSLAKIFPKETTLELFRRMCISRAFERRTHAVFDTGVIKAPIYLSFGQESVAAALSIVFADKNPDIFAQHRAHDLYLCFGASPRALIDELLGLPTGCAGGMGGSASIHAPEINMHGHDGLMGSQIPIAGGHAFRKQRLKDQRPTIAVMGDASAEEDYVLAALGYASTKKLPILYVCLDNGLSVLTSVEMRRNWSMVDLARAFNMPTLEIADDPWQIMHQVNELGTHLPAFLNIQVCRGSSHAGTRKDNYKEPEWNRSALVKETLATLGLLPQAEAIETQANNEVNALWDERLEEVKNVQR